jgi:hypothetical protein
MKKKTIFLLIVFIVGNATCVFGDLMDIYNVRLYKPIIEESQIPIPVIQYELPDLLIGRFIMVSTGFNHEITIFPSNKFIAMSYVPGHFASYSYGHIVKINDTWHFSPVTRFQGYINRLTEINLTDTGFSYYLEATGLLISMRKEDMPVPVNLAEKITIPNRIVKQQYFIFGNPEEVIRKIEFNEIESLPRNIWSHSLEIFNGYVRIMRVFTGHEIGPVVFEGFIDKKEESEDIIKGIIRFTNGVPYFYIEDGVAEIIINSDNSIIITMFYTPAPFILSQLEIPYGMQFPAKRVLEF